MANMAEQETVIVSNRADSEVRIYTANPFHVAKLDRESRAVRVAGDSEWGEFIVQKRDWNPLGGFKRRVSEEQRAALALRAKTCLGDRLETTQKEKNGKTSHARA